MAVYLFDLDDLKQINDTYGHEYGDRLIKKFGTLLSERTRSCDILARFGGDEFIAVIKLIVEADKALYCAKRSRKGGCCLQRGSDI